MSAVNWHWVCLDDDDLGLVENEPDEDASVQELWDWIHDVQEAVLESLETV